MSCPYCGHVQQIQIAAVEVEELPLEAYFDLGRLQIAQEEAQLLRCKNCGAEFTISENQTTDECPFCGSGVLIEANPEKRIVPNGLLPFILTEIQARAALGEWLGSRFWAPNDLKRFALKEGKLRGFYVPFWTFDSDTTTEYTGERGEHYWVEESYTTIENGQSVRKTRSVQKTNWWPASGIVEVRFNDILILGSSTVGKAPPASGANSEKTVTDAKFAAHLETWDLSAVMPYEPQFLVGFQTLRYDIDLPRSWNLAKIAMEPRIYSAICSDIGGDEQRVHSHSTEYFHNSFKQLLLPLYTGGYHYSSRSFRVVVNGRTGEVQGQAPVSFWKVLIAVILGLILIGLGIYYYQQYQLQHPSYN